MARPARVANAELQAPPANRVLLALLGQEVHQVQQAHLARLVMSARPVQLVYAEPAAQLVRQAPAAHKAQQGLQACVATAVIVAREALSV